MSIINTVGSGGAKTIAGEKVPEAFPSVYDAPEGYDGWSSLTIAAPVDFLAENIKKDVEIAGVTGTYEPSLASQEGTITEFPMTYTTPEGYDGMSSVIAHAPETLVAGNIKKGVEIANITGTYEPALQAKSAKATSFPVTVEPESDYYGLSQASVTAPDNLSAENIKKGVSIAGIEGTYEEELGTLNYEHASFGWARTPYSDEGVKGWNTVKLESINGLSDEGESLLGPNSAPVRPGQVIGEYSNWETGEWFGIVNNYVGIVDFIESIPYGIDSGAVVEVNMGSASIYPVQGMDNNPITMSKTFDVSTWTLQRYETTTLTKYLTEATGTPRTDNRAWLVKANGANTSDRSYAGAYLYIGPSPGENWVFDQPASGVVANAVNYTTTKGTTATYYNPDISAADAGHFQIGYTTSGWGRVLQDLRGDDPSEEVSYRARVACLVDWRFQQSGDDTWYSAITGFNTANVKRGFYFTNDASFNINVDGERMSRSVNVKTATGLECHSKNFCKLTISGTRCYLDIPLSTSDLNVFTELLTARGLSAPVKFKCTVYVHSMAIEGVGV